MRVLVIADDDPANRWILHALEEAMPLRCIVRPDWSAPRPHAGSPIPAARARRLPLISRLQRRMRHRWFSGTDADARRALADRLFGTAPQPALRTPIVAVPAWEINHDATRELIASHAPDLILVSGAPLLKESIYAIAALGSLNLHFGISPSYRGMHTIRRPWQLGDYGNLGATIHHITDGTDCGPVLCRVFPELEPHDSPTDVMAKIVMLSTTALIDLVRWQAAHPHPLAGRTFTESGTLIRFHDRKIREDLRDRLRRLGGEHPPLSPQRVERFYAEA